MPGRPATGAQAETDHEVVGPTGGPCCRRDGGTRVVVIAPRSRGCAILVRTRLGDRAAPCPVPPAWRGTWRTTTGMARMLLVCEDHRASVDLSDVELLGCE